MSTAVAKLEPTEMAEPSRQLEAIKRILSQQTPKSEIRYRTGRGGKQLAYTDGPYVIRTLNEAFGWDWDFVADGEEMITKNGQPFEIKCRGMLTVRMGGRTITKTQYGCQPIEGGDKAPSIGDCYKGAATDALKKCASLLGIALDLYDSDYKPEKYAEPEPQDSGERLLKQLEGEVSRRQAAEGVQSSGVRNVKLAGAQPMEAQAGELPTHLKGQAGQVCALARALKWNDAALVGLIVELFGTVVMPGQLAGTLEFMTGEEHRELIRVLKGKLQGNGGR